MTIRTVEARATVLAGLIALAAVAALAGCAGTDGSPGPGATPATTAPVPSGAQLSAALLTPADLSGTWTSGSWASPDGEEARLVTYNLQCAAAADALAAADRVEVDASTSLAKPVARGEVFVVEYLVAEDPTTIERTFTALRDGATACLGSTRPQDGEVVVTTDYAIPAVGEDRFATSTPAGSSEGPPAMHTAYVRKGPLLLVVHTGATDSAQLDDEAIAAIISRAVDKLP